MDFALHDEQHAVADLIQDLAACVEKASDDAEGLEHLLDEAAALGLLPVPDTIPLPWLDLFLFIEAAAGQSPRLARLLVRSEFLNRLGSQDCCQPLKILLRSAILLGRAGAALATCCSDAAVAQRNAASAGIGAGPAELELFEARLHAARLLLREAAWCIDEGDATGVPRLARAETNLRITLGEIIGAAKRREWRYPLVAHLQALATSEGLD